MTQTKFLITGATGDTGRYATETLPKQGFAVRALVHREDERAARLPRDRDRPRRLSQSQRRAPSTRRCERGKRDSIVAAMVANLMLSVSRSDCAGRRGLSSAVDNSRIRPPRVTAGLVTCKGNLNHVCGRIATNEARLTDTHGRIYAHGTMTYLIFPAVKNREPYVVSTRPLTQ